MRRQPYRMLDLHARQFVSAASAALFSTWTFPEDRSLSRPEAVAATVFEQRDIDVDGVRLRYVDQGPGKGSRPLLPPVVILPGHTARIEDYDALVPMLSADRRLLLPDLPGKGYAGKPIRHYDFAYYEDSVIGFLDALGVGQVDLVGGSLGANLALRLAHREPTRVRRVVAWAPGSLTKPRPRLARAIRAAGRFPPAVRLALQIHSRFWFSPGYPGRDAALRDKFAHYREVMGPGFAAMYAGMAADSVGSSLLPLAPAIGQPTLLLVGSLDEGGGVQAGIRRLQRRLPRADLRVVDGAGHSLLAEALETVVTAISGFLNASEPSGHL